MCALAKVKCYNHGRSQGYCFGYRLFAETRAPTGILNNHSKVSKEAHWTMDLQYTIAYTLYSILTVFEQYLNFLRSIQTPKVSKEAYWPMDSQYTIADTVFELSSYCRLTCNSRFKYYLKLALDVTS